MATATAYSTFLRRAIRELEMGIVCIQADESTTAFTAVAAGSVTVPSYFQNTNYGSNHFSSKNSMIIRMGAASVADAERYAGALTNSSGLLAHTGANYADTTVGTEVPYLLYWGVRMADVTAAANRVLARHFFPTRIALSLLSNADGDMVVSTDTNWTDIGTPGTSAKSTTVRRTPYGVRSYNLINSATNEGTRSATLPIVMTRNAKAFAIASTNIGTSSLRLRDITNGAAADTAAVTSSEEEPILLHQNWQSISSTAREWALDLTNTSATGDSFWNMAWAYLQDRLELPLPSYASEHYSAPQIFRAVPRRGEMVTNGYAAADLEFDLLTEGVDYDFHTSQPDANPHMVIFKSNAYFEWPLFVQAKVPYSFLTTFAFDEATTTTCPVLEFLPDFKRELLDTVLWGKMPQDLWALHSAKVGMLPGNEISRSQIARVTTKVARPTRFAGMARLRG